MGNDPISTSIGEQVHHFEIGEYLHHNGEVCKVKVFQDGKLVASLEPDAYMHIGVVYGQYQRAQAMLLIHLRSVFLIRNAITVSL
jgi:hypothetical protein